MYRLFSELNISDNLSSVIKTDVKITTLSDSSFLRAYINKYIRALVGMRIKSNSLHRKLQIYVLCVCVCVKGYILVERAISISCGLCQS